MADIYQQIWDADQEGNGIKAISKDDPIDEATREHGYVVVDDIEVEASDKDRKVLLEVVIPEEKMSTYRLAEKLFNNYTLDQTKPENNTVDEDREIQEFLEAIVNSKPMTVARKYIAHHSGQNITEDVWWDTVQRIWFEQFDSGRNKDLSGFEHVVVGEQKGGKVQGYHFWYKYYLDEHFLFNNDEFDLIDFKGLKGQRETSPEIVTLSYTWRAFDFERRAFRPLTKPIGGFWVGPSIEGLMAMGTIRFFPDAFIPKKALINKVEYNLQLFRNSNNRCMRTFYPEFVRQIA